MKSGLQNPINADIKQAISDLSRQGTLFLKNRYLYLDADDQYIHRVFPLLKSYFKDKPLQKPNYFLKENPIGAHITVAYPNEPMTSDVNQLPLLQSYNFTIDDLFMTTIGHKHYYALKIISNELAAIRRQLALTKKLDFKGHAIDFHITIATAC